MNCRHILASGNYCRNQRFTGSRYCARHMDLHDAPVLPRQEPTTGPAVLPDFIARLLAATEVDSYTKRTFAQEFCEAFIALDHNFSAANFMAVALATPPSYKIAR